MTELVSYYRGTRKHYYSPVIDPEQRAMMPDTRPDIASLGHKRKCKCWTCRRPGSQVAKAKMRDRVRKRIDLDLKSTE